jgi:cytochrome c553
MARIMVMLLALAPLMAVAVGDPEAGEEKAAICAACHGVDGNSVVSASGPRSPASIADYATRQTIWFAMVSVTCRKCIRWS